jgi:glycerol-3-phosphate dehydrogenase
LNKKLKQTFGGRVWAVEHDGCLALEGELEHWDDIIRAAGLALRARKKDTRCFLKNVQNETIPAHARSGGLLNNIRLSGGSVPPMRIPALHDTALEGMQPDVLVIGGGITGCAIARELSRCNLNILLVEKEHDLAVHASSRNDGMVHPGIDLWKYSWKSRYNRRGNAMFGTICEELGVDFDRCGQYLCFGRRFFRPALYLSLIYWKWMGIPAQVIGKKELRRREPGLTDDIVMALFFPNAGVVCPYGLTIAYGENAVQNGVRLSLDTAVLGMETADGKIAAVQTSRGMVYPRLVVNAAGVFAEETAAMAKDRFYSIHPRRGTNSILDKKYTHLLTRSCVSKMGTASKSAHTKGGGVIRTVDGNILVGPDAHETFERENFSTNREAAAAAMTKFSAVCTGLNPGQIITWFTGVRAPVFEEDFVVCKGRRCANLIHAAGIQSPGLTAAPAIAIDCARFAVELLEAGGRQVTPNSSFNPVRKPIPRPSRMNDEERAALIAQDPDYGIILCRCEEVSKGEITASLRRSVPCDTVDGVKRRVRPGMGRCQGGFCGPLILQIIAEEAGLPLEDVTKNGGESRVLCGPVKPMPQAVTNEARP